MTPFTRELVRDRANHRCEYCRLPQSAVTRAPFHVEHIIARQHGGTDAPANLALACDRCNLFKGPNLTAIDPESGDVVRLFDPRKDVWDEHFGQTNYVVVGLTPAGRATAHLLKMNAEARVAQRAALRIDLTLD
jgi:hypothetical protein